jgi:hypothetical protein
VPLEVRELAGLHYPVRGLQEDEARDGLKPPRPEGPIAADHEPGAATRQVLQQKAPERVGAEARPRSHRVEREPAQVDRHPQAQERSGSSAGTSHHSLPSGLAAKRSPTEFKDIEQPELGGTIELLLDGSEAPDLNKPDNMDIDRHGNLLIQEDPANNAHLARIVAYHTETGARGVVAEFDPDLFAPDSPNLITIDEESSGIIDASKLIGPGWWVFDAQVHTASPNPENVELGQLLAIKVSDIGRVYDIP